MTTTTSILPAPIQQSFNYKLLSVPVPNMIHNIPAQLKQMPRNGGRFMRMRRLTVDVYKLSLIDLEARWGNKAQAEVEMLLAA